MGEDKIKLFLATAEHNATMWTMTGTLEKALDEAYTRLLKYTLNI